MEKQANKPTRNIASNRQPQDLQPVITCLSDVQKWNLTSNRRSYEQLKVILQGARSELVKYIMLQWNKMPRIIWIVAGQSFQCLKSLTLGANNIASLQGLSGLITPQLEQLWLWNNKLTQLRSLRKLNAPNLRVLDLSSNLLNQSTELVELNAVGLQQVNLQKNRMGNVNNMVKLQSKNLAFRVSLIDNCIPSVLQWGMLDGRKIATYFYVRHCYLIYC